MKDKLVTSTRAIGTDLVEKRLWPVALLLVGLLVAIPMFLVRADPVASPAAPGPAAATSAEQLGAAAPVVTLDGPVAPGRTRGGALSNPFFAPPPTADAGDGSGTTPADAPGGAAPAGGGGGGGGVPPLAAPLPGTPSPGGRTAPTKPDPTYDERYRVTLRFGGEGASRMIRNLPRLSPLPSSDDPFFVFLGVLRDRKTARFLVSSDVTATGDGTCRPRRSLCETIDLKPGETQFFDFDLGPDGIRQYQLDIVGVHPASASVPAPSGATGSAAPATARTADGGARDVFRAAVRFGAPGESETDENIARLTSYPSAEQPALQFMGVLEDRRTALFLVAPGASPISRERCVEADACRMLALRQGDSEAVEITGDEGSPRRYQLDLVSLRRVTAKRAENAARSHRREHPDGRDALRTILADEAAAEALSAFTFSPRLGTIARQVADRP